MTSASPPRPLIINVLYLLFVEVCSLSTIGIFLLIAKNSSGRKMGNKELLVIIEIIKLNDGMVKMRHYVLFTD